VCACGIAGVNLLLPASDVRVYMNGWVWVKCGYECGCRCGCGVAGVNLQLLGSVVFVGMCMCVCVCV